MRKDVRILLVGDRGAGKTSLILSLMRERFDPEVPPLTSDVTIPKDVTPEKVTTHIIDSSLRVQDEEQIEAEIVKANVICVVYAVDDQPAFDRLTGYWLPFIRKALKSDGETNAVPVVLVGNKIDTRPEDGSAPASRLERDIIPVMHKFKEIETCVECSAKKLLNISEVFYFAQKAVLHPTAPLYNVATHDLKPRAADVLRRVFRLCDTDNDGLLSDTELNAFQAICFSQPLAAAELEGVKEVVRESTTGGIEDNKLTEHGFLFLHKLFIERGRLETTWTVLRRFGYEDNLTMKHDFIKPQLHVATDSSTELTDKGRAFLEAVFRRFDRASGGVLSPEQVASLFATAPGIPWEDNLPPSAIESDLSLDNFLALWTLLVHDDVGRAMEYLVYLGYCHYTDPEVKGDSVLSAIKVTRSRREDRKHAATSRNVFVCFVFGQLNSGKSSLLQALGRRGALVIAGGNNRHNSAVAKFGDKYLIMKEFAVHGDDAETAQSQYCADVCDVACFCFDQSDPSSFAYAADIHSKLVLPGPQCLFAATKADVPEVKQDYEEQPGAFCLTRGLPAPVPLNLKSADSPQLPLLFKQIVDMASKPRPSSSVGRESGNGGIGFYVGVVATVAVVGVGAYAAYRYLKQQKL